VVDLNDECVDDWSEICQVLYVVVRRVPACTSELTSKTGVEVLTRALTIYPAHRSTLCGPLAGGELSLVINRSTKVTRVLSPRRAELDGDCGV